MLDLLVRELDITEKEVFRLPAPLDLRGLFSLADLDRETLKYPPFLPTTHPRTGRGRDRRSRPTCSPRCKHRDVLLHHPYDSFATSVQRFIEQAAADPQVLAIKQTLYRTSGDSPDRRRPDRRRRGRQAGAGPGRDQGPLRRAGQHRLGAQARAGRRATSSTAWSGSRRTASSSLVVRDEAGRAAPLLPHRHRQLQPEDRAACTRTSACSPPNPVITDDVARLFNHLSGMRPGDPRTSGCWSPRTASARGLIERIEDEIAHHARGHVRRGIRIKVNSIVDEADHRRALPGLAGRRAGRPVGARHLRAAAGRARA